MGEGEARRSAGIRAAVLRVYSDCGGPVSRGEWWPVRGAFVAAMRESFEGIKVDRDQTLFNKCCILDGSYLTWMIVQKSVVWEGYSCEAE